MPGGEDQRRMSIDNQLQSPLSVNSRALALFDQPAINNVGQPSPSIMKEAQNGGHIQKAVSIANFSKKLEDDLKESGQKIKHHEDNVKYLKTLLIKLDELIIAMQVAVGEYQASSSVSGDEDTVESEKETIKHILQYEKSAAALLCNIKSKSEAQVSDYPFMKDVLGVVATLGKVDDDNLSRILAEYLRIENMLAVVCRTYEGVKALEAYNKDGSTNKSFGLHALAASTGRLLDDHFLVICLENLRPYNGEHIIDDPQQRLDIQKPRLLNGETPPGFVGFAVNMISIEYNNLCFVTKTGYSLRDTLFYNLFSTLQVYRRREDMLKALPYITNGAVSLDGGIIRSSGVFSLGHRRDIDVKFPSGFKVLPEGYIDIENRMKETKWKKGRIWEDLHREQTLLEHAKCSYEAKKKELLRYLNESSLYVTQHQVRPISTPR